MKALICLLFLPVMTSSVTAAPLIGASGQIGGLDLKMLLGAGFGLMGVLTIAAYMFVTATHKRKSEAVQRAYDTQLDAFKQSIRKSGSFRE